MPSNTLIALTAALTAALTFSIAFPALAGNLPDKPRVQFTCTEILDELDILYARNKKLKTDVQTLRHQHKTISGNIAEMETEEAKLKAVATSDASRATKKVARSERRKLAKKIRQHKAGNHEVWTNLGEAEDFLRDFPKRKAELLKLKAKHEDC